MAAEERERKIDDARRNINAEARERAEVAERRWHEALAKVAAMRQCSPREVNDAPRKRGRPRKSEEEKAATAEIRKLRRQRGDGGASVRREKPSAEMQLKIRAQVLEAAWGTPDLKGKHLATFWKSEADKWGLTVKMLKNVFWK